MAKQDIYELQVRLRDYEQEIWRTVQVTEKQSLAQLGYLLMSTFEMKANHQFEFQRRYQLDPLPGINPWEDTRLHMRRWVIPSPWDDEMAGIQTLNVTQTTIKDVFATESDIIFVYDMGDEWTILCHLVRVFNDPEVPAYQLPRITDGQGYGIMEDAGGTGGMHDKLAALADPHNPEHDDIADWLGTDDVDINYFELESANKRLRTLAPAFERLYEHGQQLSVGAERMLRRGLPRKS
jgi:hypothetical protein